MKEGLRVWLERKAGEIRAKRLKSGVGVGVLVWRFSKRAKEERMTGETDARGGRELRTESGRVMGLRQFWEAMGGGGNAVTRAEP